MKIRPLFAWYDLWVGVFIDTARRRIYVLPIPCIGIVIDFEFNPITCDRCGKPFKLYSAGETICRKCRESRCPGCNGTGEVEAPGDTRDCCARCDGTGALDN